LSAEIQKYLSKEIQFNTLSRKSKNISFSEDLEKEIIVSKNRIEKLLSNF